MKNATIILLILNSLPLFIYPFVFIASVMGLAAAGGGGAGSSQPTLLFTLFLLSSLSYPLPWLIGLIGSIACLVRRRFKWALWLQLAVSTFLAVVVVLFVVTVMMEG